jgi:hypothetical protein
MPYSIVHIDLALQKNEELKLEWEDLLDFLVWNILVDSSYSLFEFGVELSRPDTHYHPWEDYFIADFTNNFFVQELENDRNNYLKLWYYYHLLIDKFRLGNEISEIYTDDEVRNAFQISRKLNAKIDFENLENKDIIEELYNYEFNLDKLPQVLKNIDTKILKSVLNNILDYMAWKNHFVKWERNHKTDDIISKYFSYDKHIDLKNRALKEINL